ncbi:MAG: carboxypeptidase-like regulatory domain-containing protein [Planctomycetaceae bacterium]|nr:carboxypeptidase-like regulatory domain-containing protein [Planctomycetaceae bacterium]
MKKYCAFLLVFSAASLLYGCAPKAKLSGLAPVQGVVTRDGVPVNGASVSFSPASGGSNMRAASGQTDAQGQFVLTTLSPQDGATPGEFIVTVVKFEKYGRPPTKVIDKETGEDMTPPHPEKNILPSKYESRESSDIKVTIPASGDKNVKIELKQ